MQTGGEINPAVIAEHTLINGMEGIHFAGIGIGPGFNDSFLNELTDIGKSVYSAMITPGDAERIFDDGFMNFIDSAVENVKFKLDYPQNFHHLISAAEEISENEEAVNSSNFAYNSQQFFFELFTAEAVSDNDTFTLTIYYQNAEGEAQQIIVERTLAQLLEAGGEEQIKSAAAITSLAQLVAEQLHCDTVLNSSLYAESNISTLFTTYKHAIESFCSLPETMN